MRLRGWEAHETKKSMGQFLTIGLVTSYIISKQRANQQASATPEAVKDVMQKRYNQSGIYNLKENEHCVYLELKPEVAEAEMIDFLNDFYALRYPDEKRRNIMADMKVIGSMTTFDEWMKLAEKKEYQIITHHSPVAGETNWTPALNKSFLVLTVRSSWNAMVNYLTSSPNSSGRGSQGISWQTAFLYLSVGDTPVHGPLG